MSNPDQPKWDRVYRDKPPARPQAAQVLAEYAHLLPTTGCALDLACGRGGNALFMARCGLDVHAWDLSAEALQSISREADGGHIQTRVFDVESEPLPIQAFDVICVSHFLHRPLFPALIDALKPGGLIYYQTFIRDKAQAVGPRRQEFLLQTNELLRSFAGMTIRAYREEGTVGRVDQGFRNQAMIVAQQAGPSKHGNLG